MTIERDSIATGAQIKVFGIGGGGTNAINTMIRSQVEGVEFVAANTDTQSLRSSLAPKKIQIGRQLTKGLGAGADPDIGRDAALEDRHEIHEALDGADMVFITAGMGGGTGTGGASVVAQIAKDIGALTVGVVTKPFLFEGNKRRKHALLGIEKLREYVDTLIVIPNQQLLQIATPDLSMVDAFKLADHVLVNAVKGISDIINVPGTVNVDFADVKTIMSSTGRALMGIGSGRGERRAAEAATQAISSPLLEDVDIEGATGILINITASSGVSLLEINEACTIIQEAAHEDANIIFGAVIDDNLGEELRVTVIATGFPAEQKPEKAFTSQSYSAHKAPPKPKHPIGGGIYAKEWASSLESKKPEPQVEVAPQVAPAPSLLNESEKLAFLTLQHADPKVDPTPTEPTFSDDFDLDPLDSFDRRLDQVYIDEQKTFAKQIDKKLDEALGLDLESRLDIPAFLRKTQPSMSPN
jgi:cell division protein FtsZ